MTEAKIFKQLNIGQSFDFVNPNSQYNSFFRRCTKISARKYIDDAEQKHTIGTIYCHVFHVE